jgi:hypothetical protein
MAKQMHAEELAALELAQCRSWSMNVSSHRLPRASESKFIAPALLQFGNLPLFIRHVADRLGGRLCLLLK